MIRAFALVLGLTLGLIAAGVVVGRMAHLRAVADLPEWTGAIAPDAGLTTGHATLSAGFSLDWRLARVGLSGPVWTGAVHRHDARLELTAQLRRVPGTGFHLSVRVDPGTATLAGTALTGHFPVITGTGLVSGSGLSLDLGATGQRLRLDGEDRADGPVSLTLGPFGWRLALDGAEGWQGLGTDPGTLLAP